tara:strand:+ start:872 stop:1543 length:672 start_codon:yes stop_codon:yes gene_type:complete
MENIIPENNISEIQQLIISKTKDTILQEKDYPKFINEIINKGIELNMNQFEITKELNTISSKTSFQNFNKIVNKLINARFTPSIIKKTVKDKTITNKNVIFRNTLEYVKVLISMKQITLENLFDNIYDICNGIIEFINKYTIEDTEKNKLIIQILLNVIEDIVTNLTSISDEDLKLVKDIKKFIEDTLPFYIESYVEADLNEEAIIQTKKHCLKLLFSCISKN